VKSPALEAALAGRRLGLAPTAYPLCFTVDRAEALQRQRQRPGSGRWSWTLQVLRALFALTDGARFMVSPPPGVAFGGVRLRFAFDPSVLDGVAPTKILDAALEPDLGPGDGSLATRQRRFVRLLARGINESLAFGPCKVTVRIRHRVHTVEIPDGGVGETETITDVAGSPDVDACPLEIVVAIHELVGRWYEVATGQDSFRQTLQLWFERVPGIDLGTTPAVLRPIPIPPPVRLGGVGAWWPEDRSTIALLRDGVVLDTALGRELQSRGVPVHDFVGVVEAPALRLTYDEASIVADTEVSRLVAWLGDVHSYARRMPTPFTVDQLIAYGASAEKHRRYEGRIIGATWPSAPSWVPTVDGRRIGLDELQRLAAEGRDIPYCWTHERASTPAHLHAYTLMLWPRELEALAQIPGLRLVPVAALHVGSISDWSALVQVSFPELALGTIARSRDVPVRIDVSALVHRRAEASQGRLELASRGAVVAEIREPSRVLPGVLLVGRVAADDPGASSLGPAELQAALAAIELHGRARVDVLAAHARKHSTRADDDAPLLRAIEEVGESTLATPPKDASTRRATDVSPSLVVDVALADYSGSLHVLPRGESGVVEVWLEGRRHGVHELPAPWTRIGGTVGVRSAAVAVDLATIFRLVARVLGPELRRVWPLASPRAPLHTELAESAMALPQEPTRAWLELPPRSDRPPSLRDALAAILGEPGLVVDTAYSLEPARRGIGNIVKLGIFHAWLLNAHSMWPRIPQATMLVLTALVDDPAELEVVLERALALFGDA
jgi:hypothetical protein